MNTMKSTTWFIFSAAFLMTLVGFMVLPALPALSHANAGMSTLELGQLLALGVIVSRGLPLAAGPLLDRFEPRSGLLLALGLRITGFIWLGWAHNATSMYLAYALVATGGAVFDPCLKKLALSLPPANRTVVFARLTFWMNAGLIAGPLIGLALTPLGAAAPVYGAAVLMAMLAVLCWRLTVADFATPARPGQAGTVGRVSYFVAIVRPFSSHLYSSLFLVSIAAHFILSQVSFAIPLYAAKVMGTAQGSNLVFLVSGISSIVALMLMRRFIEESSNVLGSVLGALIISVALASFAVCTSGLALFLPVVIFAIGEALLLTKFDLWSADVIATVVKEDPERGATEFGGLELGSGIGAALAAALSPLLSEEGIAGPEPWYLLCGIAVAVGMAIGLLGKLDVLRRNTEAVK